LVAGIIIVFVLCLGFYVTPALLGGGRVMMWSMQIERNVSYYGDWGAASALGVVLLVLTLGILCLLGRLIGFDKLTGARWPAGEPSHRFPDYTPASLVALRTSRPDRPVPDCAQSARHSAQLLGLALPDVPAPGLVDTLVYGLFRGHRMARGDLCLVRGRNADDAPLGELGHACRLRSAHAAQPMVGIGLCRLHATARDPGDFDRDWHLSVLRPAGAQQHAAGNRVGALRARHTAGRDHRRLRAEKLRHEPGNGRTQPGRQPAL